MKHKKIKHKEILYLFDKYETERSHPLAVKEYALAILKKLDIIHKPLPDECAFLHWGALLHDIGYAINPQKHNRGSYDLIKKELKNFSKEEKEIIALLALNHRGKKFPKKHNDFYKLSNEKRNMVRYLSGILRIADGMDRRHIHNILDFDIVLKNDMLVFLFTKYITEPYTEVELCSEKKANVLSDYLDMKIIFDIKDA